MADACSEIGQRQVEQGERARIVRLDAARGRPGQKRPEAPLAAVEGELVGRGSLYRDRADRAAVERQP